MEALLLIGAGILLVQVVRSRAVLSREEEAPPVPFLGRRELWSDRGRAVQVWGLAWLPVLSRKEILRSTEDKPSTAPQRRNTNMKKILLVAAALSLGATPIAAAAVERTAAPAEDASNLGGDGPTITALVVLAAVIAGVIIAADDSDDIPVSA